MDAMTKTTFKTRINALSASNTAFRATIGPRPVIVPVVGPAGGVPIDIGTPLTTYWQALQKHADDFDKLLDLVADVVAKS